MKYRVVIADPPWAFDDGLVMGKTRRGASAHYATLPTGDIAAIPVADWCEPDAVLALWTPAALLADGLAVMAAWGFRQTQVVVWVKRTRNGGLQMGMGRQFRSACELALIGVRGSPTPESRSERNVFECAPLGHSVKPDTLHAMLARMYPGGPFLELFARRAVPAWTCVGLECEGAPPEADHVGAIRADLRTWRPPEAVAPVPMQMDLFNVPAEATA
jgi:N6-adenosine-specific RNA methylase IME4